MLASTGDLRFGTLSTAEANSAFGVGDTVLRLGEILPASVSLTALNGAINIEKAASLFPSATGNLSLYADDAIRFASRTPIDLIQNTVERRDDRYFGLIDADPANLPNALNQLTAVAPDFLPASLRFAYRYISSSASTLLHARTALHGADYVPVRVYALNGDIVGGTVDSSGILRDALVLAPDKQALVYAGRDIVNLSFQGQHVHNADVTRLQAGRDIIDTVGGTDESVNGRNVFGSEPSLVLAGPGEFQLSAGRDIGPLANQNQIIDGRSRPADINNTVPRDVGSAPITGINSIGNLFNPFLPRDGAAITVLFGIGPGKDNAAFVDFYINPNRVRGDEVVIPGVEGRPPVRAEIVYIEPGVDVGGPVGTIGGRPFYLRYLPASSYSGDLVRFIQQYQQGQTVNTGFVRDAVPLPAALSPAAAFEVFRALPSYVQESFVNQVFFDVLRDTGADFGNPDSPFFGQYARGYQAIGTLFSALAGYTANNLSGLSERVLETGLDGIPVLVREARGSGAYLDPNGDPILVTTGDLDLRGTTIQSQQGGTISIFGPGGEALLGSSSAPPFATDAQGRLFAGPGTQGLLSLEQGDIRIFTDRSLLLAQSRVVHRTGRRHPGLELECRHQCRPRCPYHGGIAAAGIYLQSRFLLPGRQSRRSQRRWHCHPANDCRCGRRQHFADRPGRHCRPRRRRHPFVRQSGDRRENGGQCRQRPGQRLVGRPAAGGGRCRLAGLRVQCCGSGQPAGQCTGQSPGGPCCDGDHRRGSGLRHTGRRAEAPPPEVVICGSAFRPTHKTNSRAATACRPTVSGGLSRRERFQFDDR